MASKKFTNYIVLTVTTLLLISAAQCPQAEARKFIGVNQFCRTAAYRRICTQMVHNATNRHDATVNAIKSTLVLANRLRALVPLVKQEMEHLKPVSQESIMSTCVDNFDGIIDDLNVALQALDANDIGTVEAHLSAAFSTDCEDALTEFGVKFALKKYTGHLSREVDSCMAVLMQS